MDFADALRMRALRGRLLSVGTIALLNLSAGSGLLAEKPREWPFNPPAEPSVPEVQAADRVRNPIDAFILQRLEKQGLSLAPEASRSHLVRRLYFDLIGLPPTPEEVRAFVESSDPEAYEKLVENLLKDRRYGERWARFWLDLARYADTAGYEGDPDLPHAWRYRDYVIDAFNEDKPYDLFIKEQIAGDEFHQIMGAGELPQADPEKVVALTFLRLAPFTEPRGDETRHLMLSEMTSTVGSVFLGLTVGCAQCHDHKYDGIPIKDFYRMKAFFNTVQLMPPERGDAYQIGGALPAKFYRNGEAAWAEAKQKELRSVLADRDALRAQLEERMNQSEQGSAGFGLQSMMDGNDYVFQRRALNDGKLHWVSVSSDGNRWSWSTDGEPIADLGSLSGSNRGQWFGDLAGAGKMTLGQHTAGSGEPRGSGHEGVVAEILIYDRALSEVEQRALGNYLDAKWFDDGSKKLRGVAAPREGLRFWLDGMDPDADPETPVPEVGEPLEQWVDVVGGIEMVQDRAELRPHVVSLGEGARRGVRFEASFLEAQVGQAPFVQDQQGTLVMVMTVDHEGEGYGFEVSNEKGAFLSTVVYPRAETSKKKDVDSWILDERNEAVAEEERKRFRELQETSRFVPQHLKRLRPMAMSLRHSFGPPYEPGVPVSRVMIRGEYDNPGETVEAGFLSCITGNQEPAKIRLDPFKRWPTRSRRMALAEWIASSENPLTARVMVNRLWHRHFGRGIVPTPSDFGKLSGGPSHPELLDWLAIQFVEGGWRLKEMHRLMVTSSAYRQASRHPAAHETGVSEIDPENVLLWKFRRRRLEAEAVRDAVLAVSGRLNPESHGLPIFPSLPDGIEERVKYSESKWATDKGPESRRRSLYIYQQRTLTMPFMQAFDGLVCEDSMPRRRTSITPLQALAMYNGELVNEEAEAFAARVQAEAGEGARRQVVRAFELALGRTPEEPEIAELLPLAGTDKDLVGLCRVLYNTNEFVYVD